MSGITVPLSLPPIPHLLFYIQVNTSGTSGRHNVRAQKQIDIKEREYLEKRLRSCERNMHELCDFIKRQNLGNMGIK
jgi:hypothetical protein